MKKTCAAPLLLAFAAACSDSPSDSFTGGMAREFRKGFVQSATEQCVAKVPKTGLFSEAAVQQVCACTAEKMADRVSTDDMPAILAGNISDNIKDQIKQSTAECLKEAAGMNAGQAASERR